jgi:hypothetical protein
MRSIKNIQGHLAISGLGIALVAIVMTIAACTTIIDTKPVRYGGQQYRPPTAIRVLGAESSVIIAWNPSPDIDSSAFQGYVFTCLVHDTSAVNGVDTLTQSDPNRIDTVFPFGNLADGIVDTIYVQSTAQDGTRGPASAKILCAAAQKTGGIQIFGFGASDTVVRGLQLSINGVKAVRASQSPDSVDLVFDDRSGTFSIVSANLVSGGSVVMSRQTQLDPAKTRYVANLNDASLADSVTDTFSSASVANAPLGMAGNGVSGNGLGQIFFVRTQDGNYARIYVRATDTTGTLISKDSLIGDPGYGYNYITVDVSFQTVSGLPYSLALRHLTPKKPD